MTGDQVAFYVESMVVCTIVFGILLVHDLIAGDRQERKFRFDNVLLAHIMYFICDTIWALIKGGVITRSVYNVLIVNYLLLVLLALIGNTWFFFITAMTGMPRRGTMRGKLMVLSPMIATSVISLVWILIRPSMWITEKLEMTPLYIVFFLIAPIIYIISAFLYSMREAFKKENILNRNLYFILGIYPLTVMASGLIQLAFLKLPFFCFNSMIMIILFNLLSMEAQISVDPLTGLNNHGQLMRYALQDSMIHKEGLRTFVLMADVNEFKKINDTYGHVEGDHALVIIADTFRQIAQSMEVSPFIARYGGDEFIMLAYFYPKDDIESETARLVQTIKTNLHDLCEKRRLPYNLSISIGCEELQKGEEFQSCLERADKKLYVDKKQSRRGR